MINAVGYCRFSSNNQKCESLDAQRRAIKYFAQQEGYNILRFYEDKAISGKTDNRPLYDQGHGYNAIIRQLNALGYKTKANKPFGKNSIYELLHNEKYKGVFVYNKHTSRRPDGTRTRTNKPDGGIIRIPGGIPAIVDEELWNRVNERLKSNKRNAGSFKAKEMYLLSGLIYCGECGYAVHGNARYPAPDRPKLVTYRCSHRDNNLSCNNKEIKQDDVENFVIDQLQKYMFNDDIIPKLAKNLNEYITQNTVTNDTDKVKYLGKLKELESNKSNIIDAITKIGFADVFTQKLAEIESEIATVSAILKRLQKSKPVSEITEDMVREYLGSFKHFILKRDKPQIKKFIDSYVERVEVFQDKVKVTFKVSLGVNQLKDVEYSFEKDASRKELKSA